MKNVAFLLLLAGFIVAAGSCQKNNSEPADPSSCPVSNSLPTSVDYTSTTGFSVTSVYTYDSLNRVTQITNADSIYTMYISYKTADTVIFTGRALFSGGNYVIRRVFNSSGEHLMTKQVYFNAGGDTSAVADFYFTYDGAHQVQTMLSNQTQYVNGKPKAHPGINAAYYWENGNLKSETGSEYYYNVTYEYLPNSNGQFEYNAPLECSNYCYSTMPKPVFSKNLVSKETDGQGNVTIYSYTFEDFERVKTMVVAGNKPRIGAGTWHFHYKCI